MLLPWLWPLLPGRASRCPCVSPRRLEITFPEGLDCMYYMMTLTTTYTWPSPPSRQKKPDWERYSPAPFMIPDPDASGQLVVE